MRINSFIKLISVIASAATAIGGVISEYNKMTSNKRKYYNIGGKNRKRNNKNKGLKE